MIAITPITKPPTNLAGYDPTRDAGDCVWDATEAGKAVAFFPRFLTHIQGHTGAFQLDQWQKDYVATLFGWKRPTGTRRYRESLLAVPRKNGKTTLAAGLALYLLTCDGEAGPIVLCAASDRDQASFVFDPAAKMVKASAALSKRLKVRDSTKRILCPSNNGLMRVIAADAEGNHGSNIHGMVIDELHTQPSPALYGVLKTSTGTRTQPLLVSITTAGSNRETICYNVWEYARRVRDGLHSDPTFLPVIYEASPDQDWLDPEVWRKVNPGLGSSIRLEYLEELAARASVTPSLETDFRNLHLNIWTDTAESWLSSEQWKLCGSDGMPDLTGKECFAGVDLGSTDDLTSVVYLFPIDGKFYVKTHVWCAANTVREARRAFQSQYKVWADQGWLTLTSGKSVDKEQVVRQLVQDSQRYRINSVGFDPWDAKDLIATLEGQYSFNVVKIPQGPAGMSNGVKAVQIAVADRLLVHDNNPILSWCVQSATPYEDRNKNVCINKKTSSGKVDAAVAMCMAMLLAKVEQTQQPGLIWV